MAGSFDGSRQSALQWRSEAMGCFSADRSTPVLCSALMYVMFGDLERNLGGYMYLIKINRQTLRDCGHSRRYSKF